MTASLVQDIAVVLLAAGAAGFLCRRIGLSTIVGYLVAGIIIGPNTPFKMISSEARIDELAQVGLVFVMFAIGLQLSLTKLARMGAGTIFATALGALFMFMSTLLLGHAMGWEYRQSLFASGMLMVSSSAVISKVIQELHLTHDKTAQTALTVTVMEDIVAVVMLTILATVGGAGGDAPAGVGGGISGLGLTFTSISAYVVLILAICLLFVPRLLHRLDMSGDPELRTVSIAGLLLLLAVCATQAGFSTALGAFLFGAIIAELPQKEIIEKSFESVRSIFSSLFFVSIGMLARPADLLESSALVALLSLVCFAMFVRPLACGFALVLVGVPPHEARRGGLLLTPLGEFTFIIAQSAIAASIFPDYFYPVAIALSILTVLATPIVNRFADPIVTLAEKIEPVFLSRALEAYHEWFLQVRNKPPSRPVWRLTRPRLLQTGGEMLLVTGIFVFSELVLRLLTRLVSSINVKTGDRYTSWLVDGLALPLIFWAVAGVVILMFLISIWRNVEAVIMILARSFERPYLPRLLLTQAFRGIAFIGLLSWFYSILPSINWAFFSFWVCAGLLLVIVVVVLVFLRKLICWHSGWRVSIENVLSSGKASEAEAREEARRAMNLGLESWELHLQDCLMPADAACAGAALSELAIPARFGCVVIEVERNGYSILDPGPETRLYPGDKVLLLGKETEIGQTRIFLEAKSACVADQDRVAARAVLGIGVVQSGPHMGKSLADLGIARNTGVRIVGIQRGGERIINPTGREILRDGDGLLIVGTLEQTRQFAKWLAGDGPEPTAQALG